MDVICSLPSEIRLIFIQEHLSSQRRGLNNPADIIHMWRRTLSGINKNYLLINLLPQGRDVHGVGCTDIRVTKLIDTVGRDLSLRIETVALDLRDQPSVVVCLSHPLLAPFYGKRTFLNDDRLEICRAPLNWNPVSFHF